MHDNCGRASLGYRLFLHRLIDVALSKTASASSELSADFSAQMANDGLNENEKLYKLDLCR